MRRWQWYRADAGYDGGTSIGTATFSGSALGAVPITVGVVGITFADGGYALDFTASGATSPPNADFYCDAYLPDLALAVGSFATPNVATNGCEGSTNTSGVSSAHFWRGASGFDLNISSAGPAYTYPVGGQREIWPFPSGSLTVTLAPLYGTDGGATVSVTFAPPN
jgi:hypothetical protein